jgi:heptosyltransferase-2
MHKFVPMQQFLIIQTAFIGDVVLATGLIEKLHRFFPDAAIDFMVRKGNESLLTGHPYLREVLVWDKKNGKFSKLMKLVSVVRQKKYDKIINVQRFAATGMLTAFSGAKEKIGFDKNPLSFLFDSAVKHVISKDGLAKHEIERNNDLIREFTDEIAEKPKLHPGATDFAAVAAYKNHRYITVSPASVWFTKQYPAEKWISFLDKLPPDLNVYLLGGPGDHELGETIRSKTHHTGVLNLSGKLSFLQSAALMKDALMNYVNDSAPMHFASAMNAPVAAVYCSTLPSFGFGPLSDRRFVIEIEETLPCRPCGLHGLKVCPLGHFKCAFHIRDEQLLASLTP